MAVNSSKILPMLPPSGGNRGNDLVNEKIDERILRLLGLEDIFDLDYDTYVSLLKERLASARMTGSKIPVEEDELLRGEFRRIKGKVGRFKVTSKKVSASSFKKGTSVSRVSKIKAISSGSAAPQKLLAPAKGEEPGPNYLKDIISSLGNIIKILQSQFKLSQKSAEEDRKNQEKRRRSGIEEGLEKGFGLIKKTVKGIIAPVSNILQDILNYFLMIFVGRALVKLLRWFTDPNNRDKVRSIGRFLKDWWPTLMAGYILFGTGFGKVVRKLAGVAVRGVAALGKVLFKLGVAIARGKSLKTAAAFAGGRSGLGGGKGRGGIGGTLLKGGLAVAGTLAAGAAIDYGVNKMMGEDQEQEKVKVPESPDNAMLKMSGGGLASLSDMFKGAAGGAGAGAAFGPLGMLLGAGFGSGKMDDILGGLGGVVTGKKGTDKVPAMLTEGEFVMSKGAVQKYGIQTLEAMNAAGGGTNQPKVVTGKVHAATGGYIGDKRNVPFSRDPVNAVQRFLEYKFGVNLNNQSSWGPRNSGSLIMGAGGRSTSMSLPSQGSSGTSSGSLLTDPMGAINRIASRAGSIGTPSPRPGSPGVSGPRISMPNLSFKGGKLPSASGMMPGPIKEVIQKTQGSGAATYRDAGSIYAKQMLGGMGGPVSERDLSKDSQQELQKAIGRAKKRTGSEIAKAEAKIKELRAQGAKDGNPALETQKSFLKNLKAGGIRVQYTDYADEKGNLSESAKNAKNILGQFWAKERSKKEGGGYRIEDKYDFDMLKTKDPKTGKMRDMNTGELISQGVFGKGKTTQQRLQAAYLLNPFRGKGDVDMVLGGNRTAAESLGLTGSKTLLGGMLGISGKPKDKNTQALEAKRPWWDKMGMFGGASGQMKREQKEKQDFLKKNPAAKLYNKPQKNTGQPYKSRFARPKNAGIKPVGQPPKPKPKVITKKSKPAGGGMGGARGGSSKPPSFKATTASHRRTKNQYGIK